MHLSKALKGWVNNVTAKMDGFKNLVTGYGTNRDHGHQFNWSSEPRLDKATLDGLYSQHPIAYKLVDLLPNHALREWIDIQDDRLDEKQKDELLKLLKEFRPVLHEGLCMAGQHGGAAIYYEAPGDTGQPISGKTNVYDFHVIERHYLTPKELKRSMRHDVFMLQKLSGEYIEVHRSRLGIIQGERGSRDWMLMNQGWGDSRIQRSYRPLIAYSLAHGMVPNILKDFIRDVIKIDGMRDLAETSSDEDIESFKDRLDAIFQAESAINKTVLDSNDDYISQTRNVAGINDLIRNPEKWLCASSGIPHTLLFGESPGASLSQSGSSQEKDWNKTVSAYQENTVRPLIEQFLMLHTGLDIDFRFNPLDVPTQKEQSETFKNMAMALETLAMAGFISQEEGRTVFEGDELKMLPVLNQNAAAAMNAVQGEANEQELESQEGNQPQS